VVGKSRTQNNVVTVNRRGLKIMEPETNLSEIEGEKCKIRQRNTEIKEEKRTLELKLK